MKVKKYIGKTVNGFQILDSYLIELPTGKRTRKVLIKCEKCGREFERNSGVDFEHIKCKCMCAPTKPAKYCFIEWQGKKYTKTDFCKLHEINVSTFDSRLKSGLNVEDAVKHQFLAVCEMCGKQFISSRPAMKYCGTTCRNRAGHGKGKYKPDHVADCVVCGKSFETIRDDAKTCSKHCRNQLARIDRNKRYTKLKTAGKFDESATLENVYLKFNGICQYCGKHLSFDSSYLSDDYPSIDYIKPLSKGGTHEWDNLQLLCRKCNYLKSNTG